MRMSRPGGDLSTAGTASAGPDCRHAAPLRRPGGTGGQRQMESYFVTALGPMPKFPEWLGAGKWVWKGSGRVGVEDTIWA